MCICVNSPNEYNFTKRILPPHSTHPLSNKLTNTHSFLFGNVSRGQDFYEFLFSFFFISIVKAPTSQTTLSSNYTLQYSHLLFRIPYICTSVTHTEIHSNGIFIITHSKYIHDISHKGGVQDYNFCMSNTVPQKKSLKRKLKHVKKWVFLGGER